jgi:hypothetical protein
MKELEVENNMNSIVDFTASSEHTPHASKPDGYEMICSSA